MRSRNDLHDYQKTAVEFIKYKKRCGLILDLGLGKTVTTLTALSDLSDSFAVDKILIIAPLRVANSVWQQEASQWAHLKHLKVSICTGSEKERIESLRKDADVYVINRENVVWLVNLYQKRWPFDCVVIDESSSFKSASSARFKALKKVLKLTEYMILLSGTPAPNGLLDLWSQLYLIDSGLSLGRTMRDYKQRFFESDYMGYKFTPRANAEETIQQLIKPVMLSMSANDYLTMPERIDLIERVNLPASVKKDYAKFEKQLFLDLGEHEIEAINAAVLSGKLLQWANGAVYVDENQHYAVIHDAKLDALEELLEVTNENVLLAYNFKSDLERLLKRFPDAVQLDKNPTTVTRWNDGQIKLLLAHPASAGHGLNLQYGGSLIVWFGLNWSLELYQQFNGRLHRQGQQKPVRIVHIVADGSIDERVIKVLAKKDATQKDLLLAIKNV